MLVIKRLMLVDRSAEEFTQVGNMCSLGDGKKMSILNDKHGMEVTISWNPLLNFPFQLTF